MVQSFWDYLTAAPNYAHEDLLGILTLVESAFPEAEQRIYHRLPSFFKGRWDFLNIGAHKHHISLYLSFDMIAAIRADYPCLVYTKSTVQLPYGSPVLMELVADICRRLEIEVKSKK